MIAEATTALTFKFESQKQDLMAKYRTREMELMAQIEANRKAIDESQKAYEKVQSKIFKLRSKEDQVDALRENEFKLLMEDIERSNALVSTLRKERVCCQKNFLNLDKDDLQQQVNVLKAQELSTDVELLEKLRISEEKQSRLQKSVAKLEIELKDSQQELETTVAKLESNISLKDAELSSARTGLLELQEKIKSLPLKEEFLSLQRKLQILQAVRFNAVEVELEDDVEHSELEKVLLNKNRSLESELIRLRNLAASQETECSALKVQFDVSQSELEIARSLVLKLEQDVANLSLGKDDLSFVRGFATQHSDKQDPSRLEIIIGQRDRFRQKVEELENDKIDALQKLEEVRAEISMLRNENIRLFEKYRFASSSKPKEVPIDLESGPFSSDKEVEEKYKRLYEDRTNPFKALTRKVIFGNRS
jgi:homeobox protein cut-like